MAVSGAPAGPVRVPGAGGGPIRRTGSPGPVGIRGESGGPAEGTSIVPGTSKRVGGDRMIARTSGTRPARRVAGDRRRRRPSGSEPSAPGPEGPLREAVSEGMDIGRVVPDEVHVLPVGHPQVVADAASVNEPEGQHYDERGDNKVVAGAPPGGFRGLRPRL